jgi:hypothetical protein
MFYDEGLVDFDVCVIFEIYKIELIIWVVAIDKQIRQFRLK